MFGSAGESAGMGGMGTYSPCAFLKMAPPEGSGVTSSTRSSIPSSFRTLSNALS